MRNFRQIQAHGITLGIRFSGMNALEFVRGIPLDVVGIHPVEVGGKEIICEVCLANLLLLIKCNSRCQIMTMVVSC